MGWSLEQLGLVEGVPAHGMLLESDGLQGLFPLQPFCDSMVMFPGMEAGAVKSCVWLANTHFAAVRTEQNNLGG